MNNDIMNLLRAIPLFGNLSPVFLTRLSEKAVSMNFEKATVILESGKNCNSIFIVASGNLELYKKLDDNSELIFQSIGRGGIFGEAYVADGSSIDANLRATETSNIVYIDRHTIISLLKENHEFSRGYIRHLCKIVREAAIKEDVFLKILMDSDIEVPEPYEIIKPGKNETAAGVTGHESGSVALQEENSDETEGDGDVFFKKDYACPLCKIRFSTLKPRQKYVLIERTDDDFCVYYKTVNPLFYEINVCPQCGYSFNNSTADPIKVEISDRLFKVISAIWGGANYCGTRDLNDAVETFKLALESQKEKGINDAVMGRLFLKLAWLYRYSNEKEREYNTLEKALYHLTKSFDSAPEDAKEEMNLMFLLGQLNRKMGSDREAVNWFIRITQHPERKTYPYMVNKARDAWQEIRAAQKS